MAASSGSSNPDAAASSRNCTEVWLASYDACHSFNSSPVDSLALFFWQTQWSSNSYHISSADCFGRPGTCLMLPLLLSSFGSPQGPKSSINRCLDCLLGSPNDGLSRSNSSRIDHVGRPHDGHQLAIGSSGDSISIKACSCLLSDKTSNLAQHQLSILLKMPDFLCTALILASPPFSFSLFML